MTIWEAEVFPYGFFVLFIFTVVPEAGPRFFNAIREEGLKYFALAVVVAVAGSTLELVFARMLGLER